ncbi:transposase, partial [Klebsiella pneumoniae]|uniref:transposase n=1 Tax=Klebsiella pneumoniae TaxID=573 RepID=UPI00396867CE
MRKARFTEHQIIAVLKSVEAGRTVKDVCREAGISEASYYNWKAKFGGMEASGNDSNLLIVFYVQIVPDD